MGFQDDSKHSVQQATDIVELVGEHVALKRQGREFVGLCPFHDDHSPSMHVVPDKQIYKCFSCGAGGDVFAFVMNYHRMSFPEALAHLAQRAGIELAPPDPGARRQADQRQRLLETHQRVAAYFQKMLLDTQVGAEAREYLSGRGISDEMVHSFSIGLAPAGWSSLLEFARQRKWSTEDLEAAGLLLRSEKTGNPYDRFRNRLIFPIADAMGRPIAFGGRKLDPADEPKYLNSPEHALFDKSATLYGLHLARSAMIQTRRAVIVEGYTDVIGCHQAGACNVVATLGTALTPRHAAMLRRYVEQVALVFDGDEAGQKAADRALEVFLREELDVAIAVLPDGLDPADLLASEGGSQRWQQAIEGATDALEYQFQRLGGAMRQRSTVTGRQQAVEAFIQSLVRAGLDAIHPLRRAMVQRRLGELTGLAESTVASMLRAAAPRRRVGTDRPAATAAGAGASPSRPQGGDSVEPGGPGAPEAAAAGESSQDQAPAGVEDEPALSSTPLTPRMRGLLAAQRQIVGSLLCEPMLFCRTLPDGLALDEAVTPSEIVGPDMAALYEQLYNRLIDGGRQVLAALLADLGEQGRGDLIELATDCERQMQQQRQRQPELFHVVFEDAVACVRRYHQQRRYERMRQAGAAGSDLEQLLRRVAEHNRPRIPTRMPQVSPAAFGPAPGAPAPPGGPSPAGASQDR